MQKETNEKIITLKYRDLLINFHDYYRIGEFHKFSPVRGFTSKKKWNHFQKEEEALSKIITNIYSFIDHLIT